MEGAEAVLLARLDHWGKQDVQGGGAVEGAKGGDGLVSACVVFASVPVAQPSVRLSEPCVHSRPKTDPHFGSRTHVSSRAPALQPARRPPAATCHLPPAEPTHPYSPTHPRPQVWDNERVVIIPDHYIFTADARANRNVDILRSVVAVGVGVGEERP